MADKKCTVYIIDVGPTMWKKERKQGGKGLDLTKKAVLTMLEAKVNIFSSFVENNAANSQFDINSRLPFCGGVIGGLKTDLTSLIVYGTDETNNYMNDESGGYENISVLYPIEQPKLPILRTVNEELPHGNQESDALDAISLAVEMINTHCRTLKYTKKIYLLTDGESPIDRSNREKIVEQANSSNVELNILGVDFDDEELGFFENNKSDMKKRNEKFFRKLVDDCQQGTVFSMEETLRQLSKPYIRVVRPTPVYKGTLSLGDFETNPQSSLVFNVEMYNRTTKAKLLTAKKYSSIAETSTSNDKKTFEVNVSKSHYISNNNEAVEVQMDELNKAYILGKTYVPVDELNEEIFNLPTKESMQIICFLKSDDLNRTYFMSNVSAILPPKEDPIMAQRLSAFIHALYEKESYAIVRYVRKNNETPKLGILIPYIKTPKECLHFIRIAFREDYRRFTFPSLDRVISKSGKQIVNHPYLPTDQIEYKMGKFIEGMDLTNSLTDEEGKPKEHLKVKECFNPIIHRTKRAICHRALHTDESIPSPDPEMVAQTKLIPCLIEKNKELIDELREILKIKKVIKEKGKTGKRRFADANRPPQIHSLDEILNNDELDTRENGKRARTENDVISDTLSQQEIVREVGTVDPVSNFKAMILNRDEDLVTSAVEQMSGVILHYVKTSFGEGLYKKAIECMKALRQACAQENETSRFNDFLKELKTLCFNSQPPKTHFWESVIREKISLISEDEAPDSTTTTQEAESFLNDTADKSNISAMNDDEVATDDL
ncbi:12940_t:CDS:10, partial [Acaulospora morrowiae]